MKTIINEAMRQDEFLFIRSPFANYKLKTEPTNRMYLTKNEFEKLYSMRNSMSEKLNNVLDYFLFSCLTGLRFTDIETLKKKHIIEDNYIELIMHKTHEKIIIPLLEKAKAILNHIDNDNEYIFCVLSNQKTNEYLKIIIERANIDKQISFHCQTAH
jgi:integrase